VGIQQSESQTRFDVLLNGVTVIADAMVALPGKHNVLNALAAVAVALELGIALEVVRRGLANFGGIGRRLQNHGEIASAAGPILLIDDYAHHPREIEASCEAIRSGWPARRLVVAFQPHRFTRTHELLDDFANVLSTSDVLLITEVYAAGEAPISGADARALCRAVRARGKVNPVFVEDLAQLGEALRDVIEAHDVVLTLGAGSIGAQVPQLRDELRAGQ